MYDRENTDNNHFWGLYIFYVYLTIIGTTDNAK